MLPPGTRTRTPEMDPPANHPVSGFPLSLSLCLEVGLTGPVSLD